MEKELFDYLKTFMITNEWWNGNAFKQTRAIFTTLCCIGDIEADTRKCDGILWTLYKDACVEEIMEYDEFENFMLELIV